mgnify:CR=1 FL=1
MESKIKRVRVTFVSGWRLLKNSIYIVYESGKARTILFDDLRDIPTTVFDYIIYCIENGKYTCTGSSYSKMTKSLRTHIIYDKTLKQQEFDL